MPIYVPGKVTLRQTWQPMDPDAAAYITAVEAADEIASPGIGALEEKTKIAIDNFVLGCKADGIWSAIKASCILAGARTLAGALVPLVGTAPTNYNFVSGDYNRETGLVGDGSTKYLDSNRKDSDDPLNSSHLGVFVSAIGAVNHAIGNDTGTNVRTALDSAGFRSRSSNFYTPNWANGFSGISRNIGASFIARQSSNNVTETISAATFNNNNYLIFSQSPTGVFGNPRIAFYSIGESLDLAKLDARVTDLINAIGVAIP